VLVFLPGQDDIEALQCLLEENLPNIIGKNDEDCNVEINEIKNENEKNEKMNKNNGIIVKKGILKDFEIRPLYAAMPPDEQLSMYMHMCIYGYIYVYEKKNIYIYIPIYIYVYIYLYIHVSIYLYIPIYTYINIGAFAPAPAGVRKFVLSTNIAETSVHADIYMYLHICVYQCM
jgi:hypothetical protein